MPEQFGRKRVELFEYIVQQVKDRTQGWSNNYLSPVGKEILIKSIAMAMPVYSMNCFLLPTKICNDITSVIYSFWWGRKNGYRKIPWVAWNRMCLPKKEGDLGFKDLDKFNKALIAKQAWRILTNPSSLLARLCKGVYYPHTDYLRATTRNYASYGWRSLQEGKSLLHHCLRVRLGNGESTRIWEDPWLPTLPPRPANGPALDRNMKVADLWLPNKREWNPVVFEGVLNPEDQAYAKELYLSQYIVKDTYEWAYTSNAKYTVRSGYWVATHIDVIEEDIIQPPYGSIALKQKQWKLPIAPKIQHFLWRCLSKVIPTATHLITRNIPADPLCQHCCQEEETVNHILFTCPYARAVWCLSGIDPGSRIYSDNFEDNLQFFIQIQKNWSPSIHNKAIPFWIIWRL